MVDPNVLPGGFGKRPWLLENRSIARVWYPLRAAYRHCRVSSLVTRLLGPQYRRSRSRIEIDVTYRCNLQCMNCNRSLSQAPQDLDIPLADVIEFVQSSLRRGIRWRRIRVLGGEPTLHPHFADIIAVLRSYRSAGNPCSIEVVTNGYGSVTERRLAELPGDIWIENSRKQPGLQPGFRPFGMAPCDDPAWSGSCFANGCQIMSTCGMGLTPLGYYPCAIAGGIDRVSGLDRGRKELPAPEDAMNDILEWSCRLCGRFKDGHHIPKEHVPLLTEECISPTWMGLYKAFNSRRGRRVDDRS
jgi:hypothetical protein